MDYDFTHKHNIAVKTIYTMEFLFDEVDIEFLSKYYDMKKEDRDNFRVYVDGILYKLHSIPNSMIIYPPQKQKLKLELEPCVGKN